MYWPYATLTGDLLIVVDLILKYVYKMKYKRTKFHW